MAESADRRRKRNLVGYLDTMAMNDTETPRAVAGIRALRETLQRDNPHFQAAVTAGREANAFVQSVRADLAAHRKLADLSQEDVGQRLDLGQSAISKFENGQGDLSMKTVYRFAQALGFRPVLLMVPSARAPVTVASADSGGDLLTDPHAAIGDGPTSARAVAVEEAQVALLRGLSDIMPGVLSGLLERE